MDRPTGSESGFDGRGANEEDLAAVVASLEPDQIISTKEKHHCPRRKLTRAETIVFWSLRAYLIFMFGVVLYQIWSGVR
jgi:hypothetical protein